jgi:hypothetical protein
MDCEVCDEHPDAGCVVVNYGEAWAVVRIGGWNRTERPEDAFCDQP